jgi:hypothetical protein
MNVKYKAILSLAAVTLLSGCGSEEMLSRWRDRDIIIDGNASEWRGTEQHRDDDKGVTFSVFNDDENLYMCITTWNTRTQQQILVRGLIVWFDAEGGDERRFGIEFPITKGPEDMSGLRDIARSDRARTIEELLVRSRSEMIVGRTKDYDGSWMFVEDGMAMGIEAALDIHDRILVYELKVPLAEGQGLPFQQGTVPGALAGIGVEMGKLDVDEMQRQMRNRGGTPGDVRARGMGSGMRGGGGRRPEMREAMEEEIEVWAKVRLATAP